MTWDQFIALMLGVAATAIIRLLDKYLPPPAEPSRLAVAAGTEVAGPPPAGSSSSTKETTMTEQHLPQPEPAQPAEPEPAPEPAPEPDDDRRRRQDQDDAGSSPPEGYDPPTPPAGRESAS